MIVRLELPVLSLLCVGLLMSMAPLASEEGQEHRHHVAIFIGATHAEGKDEPTVGLDYECRLTPKIGVGHWWIMLVVTWIEQSWRLDTDSTT